MTSLRSRLTSLVDPNILDESKLKAVQEVSENLESIIVSQHYTSFLETAVPRFLQVLKEGEPQFVDCPAQQLRKLVLEIIHRMPANDNLRNYVKPILSTMFVLLEMENEENVLVCLRIIIELHKQFRPPFSPDISQFLLFVKNIYSDLPKTMTNLFEIGGDGKDVGGIKEKSQGLPKAVNSLKVLAELPIIVVLMYQLYKNMVHSAVSDFIPLTMNTITLQPSLQARNSYHFNKETYVDFVAVQIKFLSFLAYIIRIYQDQVNSYAPNMVQGMLSLLRNCPQEVAHLRRELLIAARHILATNLRNRFVSCIDQLFDEELLIGTGWTTRETVRSLAYSILADLVHHVRSHLSLAHLSLAVHLFSKNVHDDTLSVSIQTMSCKLLLNLVECIRQQKDQEAGRELLMKMMEVFILKFQTIAQYQIPEILSRCVGSTDTTNPSTTTSTTAPATQQQTPSSAVAAATVTPTSVGQTNNEPEKKQSTTILSSSTYSNLSSLSVPDVRGMVKTLVCGMKTITWGVKACKATTGASPVHQQRIFMYQDIQKFIKLLKYALVGLDIYRVSVPLNGPYILRSSNCQTVKTKEEKEVLEHFAGMFTMMSTTTFKEIFTEMIEYLVERIQNNYALQIIPNSFLVQPSTSATFANILINFLLERMEDMGNDIDKSNLYLKLFKLVFGSVTLFAQENEVMLKPYLHQIVNQSMELANTAQEPYNYFLLLRALFRSIGGGSHDLLYQEFLPLLSNLLQGLNRLQSRIHKQYMNDLFVELCLTVPVRLSSLLPYLHMLMDPLVSALNGSQTLISQGLRTLELCVDNLQPDFLYEHIQPVRAELMQALWRTLHNPDDNIAMVAYRVLGKFGGSSRKMLKSPQQLAYCEALQDDPAIRINFHEYSNTINLPVGKAVECAVIALKSANTDPLQRQHSWQVVKSFLVSMMSLTDVGSDLRWVVTNLTYHSSEIQSNRLKHISLPVCSNKPVRNAYKSALTGLFVAAAVRDLRNDAVPFMAGVVRHITMVAVVQQCSTSNVLKQTHRDGMDVFVLVEAISKCVCAEEKELCRIGEVALQVVLETATTLMGGVDKASELPLFEVVVDKLCGCCYERAWFAKSGGCLAISFLSEKMPLRWLMIHQQVIIMALMYVLLDLSNEVSSGTVDQAKQLIDKILKQCNKPLMDNHGDLAVQQKSFYAVSKHLVKEVISPNQMVRKQSHHCLELLAEVTGKTITEIMEPHKELLADMIPPKKHLLKHQPVNTQIALMDGNTFCTSLNPRLFSIDLNIQEHKVFFYELLTLCDTDDVSLAKLPCYKSVPLLVPLRVSGLAALAACHYLPQMREKIFTVLYKAINSNIKELQDAGKEAMKKFMAEHSDIELVHTALRPLLLMLADFRNLNVNLLRRLSCMISLFPNSFNEKMCEQLLAHLHRWVDVILTTTQAKTARKTDEVQICVSIMEMFPMLPASSFRLAESLAALVTKGEKALGLEIGSPFRMPFFKFLVKFPPEAVDFFLMRLSDVEMSRLFHILLKKSMAAAIRDILRSVTVTNTFVQITFLPQSQPKLTEELTIERNCELRYQGVRLARILAKEDKHWLPQQTLLVDQLKKLWYSNDFHNRLGKDVVPLHQRNECKLVCKLLLNYLKHNEDDIDLLFHLLRVYNTRQVISLHFLSRFLEDSVIKNSSILYKRKIFFKFVEVFLDIYYLQELKAKILQYIILPMFAYTFEEGKVDELLGGSPFPDLDSDENVISVFINKVINPDKPFESSDPTCILLLQLSSLLVEHAAPHIHDSNNKKQGAKLRRLMAFAWPCLLPKQCVDPATKYYGHLLLANIIAKFAIHKRIVLQVFHSLLKAHALEARAIVRQALEILTPVVPIRMEDANATLVHWTKKIIVEEGHSMAQLVHMLQLLVRHFKVYYPVRQHLVQHMVSSIQRLGFTTNATIEQRRLAVDLAEVIIKWEYQRVKEQQGQDDDMMDIGDVGRGESVAQTAARRLSFDGIPEAKKPRSQTQVADPSWMLDKQHADAVMNFLLRLACQVNDTQPVNPPVPSPGEVLSKRCVLLIKSAMKQDLWSSDYVDIKLVWFDKLLCAVDQPQIAGVNQSNICTGLDLLLFLLSTLPRAVILAGFKPLQKGITTCMNCQYIKVVRYVQGLMAKLISLFPTEPASSSVACKHEELDGLYSSMNKMILDGLQSYDKSNSVVPSALQNSLLILKAVCASDPCYIDRVMGIFIKVLQKLHKEHVSNSAPPGDSQALSEVLQLSLDLAKNRIGSVSQDIRKLFVNIMANLIDKSADIKLLKTVTKIVEEWMTVKGDSAHHYPTPLLRDKALLLTKMMNNYEKRFPDDTELNSMFYDIVLHVYRDPSLTASELTTKLESAFLCGLKCPQAEVRTKFFEIYDLSIQKRLYDRLVHIVCGQSWEYCSNHFWVKQCIEIVLSVANWETSLIAAPNCPVLPSIASVSSGQSQQDVPQPAAITSQLPEELLDTMDTTKQSNQTDNAALEKMVHKHLNFLQTLKSLKSNRFLMAITQLCHSNTELAYSMWVSLFSRIWSILTDRQRQTLSNEISPFMCSGSHLVQSDCHPSAISAFVEAIMLCEPKLHIRSCVWKYLAKTHNCWHRVGLLLEQRAQENGELEYQAKEPPAYDGMYTDQILDVSKHETLDSLAELYVQLDEHDLWTGLWTLRSSFPETVTAIWYENQGLFEQAKANYEGVISRARDMHNYAPAPPTIISEYKLWESHWMKCAHELGQWDVLTEFGKSLGAANPFPVLENAWRISDWPAMKEGLHQIEPICPDNYLSKLNLYKGYQAVCYPDDQHLSAVEKLVEAASLQSIRQWKKLPMIVSNVHMSLLQLSQQIMELHEGAQIQNGLQPANLGRQSSLNELKTIFKTWKNRLPNPSDNLSHWSDILHWRQIHFKAIVNVYEGVNQSDQSNHAMVAVHHSASAIVQYATIARQHNLTSMCLNILGKIHSIPSVPVVDCFQKIRQQIKCYLQMAEITAPNELQEGLDVIESTNLKYFNKEMIAEFFALKGTYLFRIGRSDQANKCFSSSVQMHDSLVKAWASWGDYLDQLFANEKSPSLALSAITCYLHACRNQDESKSRKYLARILWLLTYDDDKNILAEAIDKYYLGIPPVHWLPWIPQLLMSLVRKEGQFVLNLLCHIGKTFPQAIYFPIRTLYLTLKMEHREKSKSETTATTQPQPKPAQPPTPIPEEASTSFQQPKADNTSSINPNTFAITGSRSGSVSDQSKDSDQSSAGDAGPLKATPPMWRCSRIMHLLRDLHPTLLSALEGIVDQMVWFRENWYEELLRQLTEGLNKCQAVAFENRTDVANTQVTSELKAYVHKLVGAFGIGLEHPPTAISSGSGQLTHEALAKRAQAAAEDPAFQRLKNQFASDFDFSSPGALRLHSLMAKLKKWIRILELKTKSLQKSFLLEEKCRFLSNFSLATADVEIPGEYLMPRQMPYYVHIARFMPYVEIVQGHSSTVRRLFIRGDNGKVYPYLVVNDSSVSESRREERLLQLLRMMNMFLEKQKETCRRHLMFTVPRVVAVSPQMRLVEDDPTNVSLMNIFSQYCGQKNQEWDCVLSHYYDQLAQMQTRGDTITATTLQDLFYQTQSSLAPPTIMKEWAMKTFPAATDYWTFRRQVTQQLALTGLVEFVLHLTRLDPDMFKISRDSGCLTQAYFKFDIKRSTGELDANRPVPFRFTPSLQTFISPVGKTGALTMCMIAAARCLAQPYFSIQSLLRAVLRDEYIAWYKRREESSNGNIINPADISGDTIVKLVSDAVTSIMTRLQNLAQFEGAESNITLLISAAENVENLCRMDPAWNAWI